MKKIFVLGGGLVGATIANDLAKDHDVTVIDKRISSRVIALNTIEFDCSKPFYHLLGSADLVVNALPGFLGYQALDQIIDAGKNCVDISFFEEDPYSLNLKAQAKGVSVVVDCGVAPGLCNMMLGHAIHNLKSVESYECVVGGLPIVRTLPFQYKAPYSPLDVIEFYMRPARLKVNGVLKVVPALSEIENVNTVFGTLESFNTDGLRSLLSLDVPNMKERTFRYPGTAALINTLKNAGFFSKIPTVNGVSPLEVTTEILKAGWKLQPDEEEFTLMYVTIEGQDHDSKHVKIVYTLYDEFDGTDSSMARQLDSHAQQL